MLSIMVPSHKCDRCGRKTKVTIVCPNCRSKRGQPRKYGKYSLQEIAKATNMNTTTVWKYFNNHVISGDKKKKIEKFLAEFQG